MMNGKSEGYNFVRFEGQKANENAMPDKMQVGQVVKRKYCMSYYRSQLKSIMRKMMREKGMAFSIHEDEDNFVIRRDK
jgi:hypothetical protein